VNVTEAISSVRDTPEAMTGRARAYLSVNGLRHLLIGVFIIVQPGQFSAGAFIPIVSVIRPLWIWGAAFVATAVVCGVAVWLRSRAWARSGLIASAGTTAVAAAGLWLGIINLWLEGRPATIFTATILAALVAKDLIVCSQPMRTPLEDRLAPLPRAVPIGP
jgi:hypothetical protein